MKKKNIGSSFDSWLREDGTYEEVSAGAIKRVIARQVQGAMADRGLSKLRWRGGCTPAALSSTACSIPRTTPSR